MIQNNKTIRAKKNQILTLTPAQFKIANDEARKIFVCGGRRVGKSRFMLTKVLTVAINYKGEYDPMSPPIVILAMPTLKQAKRVHWSALKNILGNDPRVERIDNSEYIIKIKGNRPDIHLVGVNDGGEALRGSKIYFAALDEFQDMNPQVLPMIINPAMVDTPGSKLLAIGTPKGKASFFYEMSMYAKQLQELGEPWAYYHLTTYDNPFVDRQEIKDAEATLPPRIFKQEYLADWEVFDSGIYTCFTEKNIINNTHPFFSMYEPTNFLGVDWGDINPAIVVVQRRVRKDGNYVYAILDYFKNPKKNVPIEPQHFLDKIKFYSTKWQATAIFCDPSEPGNILTVRKMTGVKKTVKAYRRVQEGNNIIDTLFFQERLLVDSTLKVVINDITSYKRLEKDGTIFDEPEKNQEAEHINDSLRYVCATLEHKKLGQHLNDSKQVSEDDEDIAIPVKNSLYRDNELINEYLNTFDEYIEQKRTVKHIPL